MFERHVLIKSKRYYIETDEGQYDFIRFIRHGDYKVRFHGRGRIVWEDKGYHYTVPKTREELDLMLAFIQKETQQYDKE